MTDKKIRAHHKNVKTFYVYLHRKVSNNDIFYVGKGSGERAWSRGGRSTYWNRVCLKYGFNVEIVQCFSSQNDAFLLEMWLIAKLKHQGMRLVNIAEGGQGANGQVMKLSSRNMIRDAKGGGLVYCSNGKIYNSVREAGRDMNGSSGAISACCRGKKTSAYGHAWSREGFPEKPEYVSGNGHRRVKTDCGMTFNSMSEAARWVADNGYPLARQSTIASAMSRRNGRVYGMVWSYA